jgi:hypothetical protein
VTKINPSDWDGVAASKVRDFVLAEMSAAGSVGDWETQQVLADLAYAIADPVVRAETLGQLLVMPNHQLHQEIAWEIQQGRFASCLPYIRQMLESKFAILEYTCSEHAAITKWFSHALAKIGTHEAIRMIEEFSNSDDPEIAMEMKYRLGRLARSR